MDAFSEAERAAAAIREACFMVRHYRRPIQRLQRAQAIQRLGITVRVTFAASDEFEPLLVAIVEGLKPDDYRPPF